MGNGGPPNHPFGTGCSVEHHSKPSLFGDPPRVGKPQMKHLRCQLWVEFSGMLTGKFNHFIMIMPFSAVNPLFSSIFRHETPWNIVSVYNVDMCCTHMSIPSFSMNIHEYPIISHMSWSHLRSLPRFYQGHDALPGPWPSGAWLPRSPGARWRPASSWARCWAGSMRSCCRSGHPEPRRTRGTLRWKMGKFTGVDGAWC